MCFAQRPQRSDASEVEQAVPRSRVKHSTTEPLLSRIKIEVELNVSTSFAWSCKKGTA